jgi:hypothetical protein
MPDSTITSNKVALAAVVLAAGAFIVAAGAFLTILSGSREARRKCGAAAIGVTAAQVKFRWSFSQWKLKVYYPILDLHHSPVLRLFLMSSLQGIEYSPLASLGRSKPTRRWGWRQIKMNDKITRRTIA